MANFDQKYTRGQLDLLDKLPPFDPALGSAIHAYTTSISANKQSYKWVQAVQWIENILFGLGRQYNGELLRSRLAVAANGDQSVVSEFVKKGIPQPVNDILGRSIETNIALLTENRPQPRITAKSDARDDRQKAELSQLVIEYLWEELDLPEKHREIARIIMYCGVCFLETIWDETEQRHLAVQDTVTEQQTAISAGPGITPITLPVERQVGKVDEEGRPVMRAKVEYGDIRAEIVSPFELHFQDVHWWEKIGWVLKETYEPIQTVRDRYLDPGLKSVCTKAKGWDLSVLENIGSTNIQTLPLWWWERMANIVEGPGPSMYIGNPELWEDFTVVKVFDRKPNPSWPNGRTVITVGDKVLYDSPKKIGARAYDPRWPHRWHPYTRFRWEAQVGSIFGRSLVAKLIPKVKRINAIDTCVIMYQRTVPIATWIMPKGTSPVEDQHTGMPGTYVEYDPRRTNNQAPTPVHPTAFPDALLVARDMCKQEIEAMAGTEDVLRGQRPTGVNSAAMLDVLRKQALSSRSAILQAWDESLQHVGTSILQEVTKHVRGDSRYEERLKILSREKASRFTIKAFTGTDLSDNVIVRVDTASQAMVSKEAKQARAIEVMQYAPGLVALPVTLQAKLIEDLGWPDTMSPKSQDINRAQILLGFVKSNRFNLCVPFPEDDPYVLHEFLVEDMKSEGFIDYPFAQQQMILKLIGLYQMEIERIEKSQIKMQMDMQQAQQDAAGAPPAGGQPQGGQ
jgi:hypothetical protein